MIKKRIAGTLAGIGVLAATLLSAGPAWADGTATGSWCGGNATFKTVNGLAQVQYISDTSGRHDSVHNGGCFGISPSGHPYWIPYHGTSWRLMPGDAIARTDTRSYFGPEYCVIACSGISAQTVVIETAAGNYYADQYESGAWRVHWTQVTG